MSHPNRTRRKANIRRRAAIGERMLAKAIAKAKAATAGASPKAEPERVVYRQPGFGSKGRI